MPSRYPAWLGRDGRLPLLEQAPRLDRALDGSRREDSDLPVLAAHDGAPVPLEGGVGEQLLDRDVLVDEDRGIAVGGLADAGRRAATTFRNRVTPAKLIHDRTCTRWGTA